MLTPRETAASLYGPALGAPRQVWGGRNEGVLAARLDRLCRARIAIDRALGTERLLHREPDDAQLAEMAARLDAEIAKHQPA